ncbi:hypothetical protein BCL69_10421, partial [Nitrosomonas communis]
FALGSWGLILPLFLRLLNICCKTIVLHLFLERCQKNLEKNQDDFADQKHLLLYKNAYI